MAKQPRRRKGIHRAQRQLKFDFSNVTPEMISDAVAAFECMLQCLIQHVIRKRDIERLAHSPVHRKRRSK
jgi:hypothetical protein